MIFFIRNDEALPGIWPAMAFLNVWRIPILFLVSGMGVRFAMERRDWKALLKDRTIRILVPLVFGYFAICPISVAFAFQAFGRSPAYAPNAGHLWFLTNIFAYVIVFLPVFWWIVSRPQSRAVSWLANVFGSPIGLISFAGLLALETYLVKPPYFSGYAESVHGFWLGSICFFIGFMLANARDQGRLATEKLRFVALIGAASLFVNRAFVTKQLDGPNPILAVECVLWMLAILGFASRHWNVDSRWLRYGTEAVFPVYIVHMPVQFGLSRWVFSLPVGPEVKLATLIVGVFGISVALYEVLRRVGVLRPLFGMKWVSGRKRDQARTAA